MIPILDSESIRKQDSITISQEPISSLDLMERDSKRFCERLLAIYNFSTVVILVGPGNNGGDGLAIARMLDSIGKKVSVLMPPQGSNCSADNLANSQRLREGKVTKLYTIDRLPEFDLVIDALFGSGLDRPIEGYYREVINMANAMTSLKVSVDMPSGMPDQPSFELKTVFKSDQVFTFQYPKLSLLLPYSKGFCEAFDVLDIGLIPYTNKADLLLVEESDVSSRLPRHSKFSHKYERGVSLLLGGGKGMTGSIVLSCGAALYAGSGLVKACVASDVVAVLSVEYPEVIYNDLTDLDQVLEKVNAIGIGPGMEISKASENILNNTLRSDLPVVIDASALRMLSNSDMVLKGKILTPHEGEFKALAGKWRSEKEKLELLKKFCVHNECVVVLKGAYTVICNGDKMFFNPIGDPAMATAGSGDVLLGVITSLLSQGLSIIDASICGVYLHAKAALAFLKERQSSTLRATDIINNLGKALYQINNT